MMARLGFAIIASLDLDVLLVDEVLAVGDAAFQRKCIGWLDEFRAGGGTLLFVSHNQALLRNMTDHVVWLDRGRIVDQGLPSQILHRYARSSEHREDQGPTRLGKAVRLMQTRGLHRWGMGGVRIDQVRVSQPDGTRAGVEFLVTYVAASTRQAVFCVGFVDEWGNEIGAAASPRVSLNDEGELRCLVRPLPLRSGTYFPMVAILSSDGAVLDRWRLDRAVVVPTDAETPLTDALGPVEMQAEWSLEESSS
jgi:hypothetical protein